MVVAHHSAELQEQQRQGDIRRTPDGLSQCAGTVGRKLHDQALWQGLQSAIIPIVWQTRSGTQGLTTSGDNHA